MSKIRTTLLVSVVVLACGASAMVGTAYAATFTDVSESHPFYEDVEFMAATGIAGGYQDGTYRPGAPVTRQAMAAFIHRANTLTIETNAGSVIGGTNLSVSVTCDPGTEVVSGGGSVNVQNVFLTASKPTTDGLQWSVTYETEDNAVLNFTVTAWVVCGPVDTGLVDTSPS